MVGSGRGTVSKVNTMEVSVYDAQADTINVDDIATDSNNRQVLRCLKRNEADDESNELYIKDLHEDLAIVLNIAQRGLMIWDGWDTLWVKVIICRC